MDKYDENEIKGRRILRTFLDLIGAINLLPTKGKFDPVDYHFTIKGKDLVAEIKIRDSIYENYPTHLMEVEKYNALLQDLKSKRLNGAFYICFFLDGNKISAYWYELRLIPRIVKDWCVGKTTATYTGYTVKKVIMIPKYKALKFTYENGKWHNN